jgi:protease-4
MKFLRSIWAGISALKNATGNLLFLFLAIFVLVALLSSNRVQVQPRSALVVDLSGNVVEQHARMDPLGSLLTPNQRPTETVLRDVTDAIRRAEQDDRITAMALDLTHLQSVSPSHLAEIGAAITRFKSTGKRVYAFGTSYNQAQYYLAAHADRVLLDSGSFQALGGVLLTGYGTFPMYFGPALEKLHVRMNVFVAGKYKDAVEPFLEEAMSDASKESNLTWLNDLWSRYVGTISTLRGLADQELSQYISNYADLLAEAGNDPATLALDQGLVDALVSESEWHAEMRQWTAAEGQGFRQIRFMDYLRAIRPSISVSDPTADKVAVITASGTILDGQQPPGTIGAESISQLIQRARGDNQVKALIVRINSPGGSVSGSETIRNELEATRNAGKPVVISMSSYAASGGYWIASSANRIFAHESTITGSIGTFMVFPSVERSLAELGIHTDGVGTTPLSGALNPLVELSPMMKQILTGAVNRTYDRFLSLVANSRDMTLAEADHVAQGRVWSGTAALELGLVDAIGDLEDAIASAADLANTTDYEVIYLEPELSSRDKILEQLLSTLAVSLDPDSVSNSMLVLSRLVPTELRETLRMATRPGLYAQCLYCTMRP